MRQAAPGRDPGRETSDPDPDAPGYHKPPQARVPRPDHGPEKLQSDSGLRTRFSNYFGQICKMVHPFELKIVSVILTFDERAV